MTAESNSAGDPGRAHEAMRLRIPDRRPRSAATVPAACLGAVLSASSLSAQDGDACRPAHYTVDSTPVVVSCPAGAPDPPAPGSAGGDPVAETTLGAASVSFGHDVRIGGNRLPAGEYYVRIHPDDGEFVRAVFHRRAPQPSGTDGEDAPVERVHDGVGRQADQPAGADGEGLLQLAVRTTEARPVPEARFDVDAIDENTGTLHFRYGSRKAALRLETTGHVRRSTPPPALPAEAREPWRVVRAALDAFLAEDVAAHVADFADDFETNFDDNAGLEAHTQQMYNRREEGRLEDMAVHLAGMDWAVDGDDATFGTIAVFTNFGRLTLAFSLERRDGRWLITYLDTRRTRRR